MNDSDENPGLVNSPAMPRGERCLEANDAQRRTIFRGERSLGGNDVQRGWAGDYAKMA